MNTLKEFDALLTKAQNLAFEQKRAALETIYDKFTREGDVSEEDYRSFDWGAGLGQMAFTPEGGASHLDSFTPGTERIVKFKKFTISVVTPEEIREAMRNNGRVKKDKVKRFAKITEECMESANWTREVITADFILRGNSTTVTNTWPGTFRDGLALNSTSHTLLKSASTWSNLQTAAAMTQLAILDGLAMLANVPDETGRPQGAIGDVYLIHGRFNMFRVTEILKTMTTPDTANLTVNPLAMKMQGFGRIIPILNPYLGDTFSGWALVDANNHSLPRFEKQPPKLMSDTEIRTGNFVNRCMLRYAIDADSAKGVLLNAGL